MPLISVIVAVYNVEQYICRCIDSILSQTHNNLEIILVNDGSTDLSGFICDTYAKNDDRIKVVHKENGGQATARNSALNIAKGEFIGFVDGDDWIEPTMYQNLLEQMQCRNADIIQCGWYIVNDCGEKVAENNINIYEEYTSDDALCKLTSSTKGLLNTSVCCKLFKSNIAQQFRFTPVRAYEDDEFVFKTISVSNKIVCISIPLYDYYTREGSTMTSNFNVNKLALVVIQKNICDLIKTRLPKMYPISQKILCSKQFYALYQLNNHNEISDWELRFNEILEQLMSDYDNYLSNPQIGANRYMLYSVKYLPRFVWILILKLKFGKTK